MSHSRRVKIGPTHVCPRCGEWWDVETGGYDTWFVSTFGEDGNLASKVWTEAARTPICPLDTATLDEFRITDE